MTRRVLIAAVAASIVGSGSSRTLPLSGVVSAQTLSAQAKRPL